MENLSNYLNVANSWFLWLSALPVALIVLIQAVIFSRKARKAGKIVGLSDEEAKKAFKTGAISAIGPAMGVFVVMLGLMAVIGAPLAWMRLSIIGAASTELTAAQMAAKAQGMELTSSDYNILNFANATWVMALNGSAWLITSALFSDRLDTITKKISGGSPEKIGILMVSAMAGAFSYLFMNQVKLGMAKGKTPILVAVASGALAMAILEKIGQKNKKIKEYTLGIAMVIGMAAAVIYKKTIMGV